MRPDLSSIARRKADHIDINLTRPVRFQDVATGFERYQFIHNALPEMALGAVDLRVPLLGRVLGTPIMVSSMTGGLAQGWEITRRLARVAEQRGGAIGVGSQRAALVDPDLARYFRVRDVAPNVLLFANLGAAQLAAGDGVDLCRRAVDMIGADALILHLNPLQEAIQPEGDRDFSGILDRIAEVCAQIEVPVVVKEVGCGISAQVACRLAQAGVAVIDVGGAGGTSWSAVEGERATTARGQRVGRTFTDWGIPTATSLRMVRERVPHIPVIASGGLRTGLDAAKALALGASLAGFAGSLLAAAVESDDAALEAFDALNDELRIAMYCVGAQSTVDLNCSMLMDDRGMPVAAGIAPGEWRELHDHVLL